jgi:PIN domain nuclease of toxin-antitoxin system
MDRLLLDTHIFLWAMTGSRDLSRPAGRLMQTTPQLYVSALSLFELKMKEARGKLELPPSLLRVASGWGVTFLDFTVEQMNDYRIFSQRNTDPFDNALLAIAEQHRLRFLTADTAILPLQTTYPWVIDGR